MSVVVIPVIQLLASIVVGVLIAMGVLPDTWSKEVSLGAASAFSLLIFLGIRLLVVAPMDIWKEQQEKIRAYEDSELSFFYDDGNPSCKREKPLGDGSLKERLWRVGVKGSKGLASNGVIVRVQETIPFIDDLPQALHPMGSLVSVGPTEWDGDGSFGLRPGEIEYVDVVRYRPSHGPEPSTLELVLQTYARTLAFCTHTLVLSAQGLKGPPITRRFQVEITTDNLARFFPLDSDEDSVVSTAPLRHLPDRHPRTGS